MQAKLGILFLGIYLLGMLRPLSPVLEYALNWEYIAKVFCENKEEVQEVQYVCAGKCHLKKELKKAQQEEHQSKKINNTKAEDYQVFNNNALTFLPPKSKPDKIHTFYLNQYSFLTPQNIFHPPISAI